MSSRRRRSRRSKSRGKKKNVKIPVEDLDKVTQVTYQRFKGNDCPNTTLKEVYQSSYVRDGKTIEAKTRRNGSQSLNTFSSCRMTKQAKQLQKELLEKDPKFMPDCIPGIQRPVVGYIRFDAQGNAYPVKGVCRDIKIKPNYRDLVQQPQEVQQYVKKLLNKTDQEATAKKISSKLKMKPVPYGRSTVKIEPAETVVKKEKIVGPTKGVPIGGGLPTRVPIPTKGSPILPGGGPGDEPPPLEDANNPLSGLPYLFGNKNDEDEEKSSSRMPWKPRAERRSISSMLDSLSLMDYNNPYYN